MAGQCEGTVSLSTTPSMQVPPTGPAQQKAREPLKQSMGPWSPNRGEEERMVDLGAMENEHHSPNNRGVGRGQNGGRALEYASNSNACKGFMKVILSTVVLALRLT